MRFKIGILLSLVMAIGTTGWYLKEVAATDFKVGSIKLDSSKEVYTLGEIVELEALVKNEGNSDVLVRGADAGGAIKIFVSDDGTEYKRYTDSRRSRQE